MRSAVLAHQISLLSSDFKVCHCQFNFCASGTKSALMSCDDRALSKRCFHSRSSDMHRFILSLSAASAVLTAGVLQPSSASATPLSAATDLRHVIDTMDPVENVAICFYVDGWNGPGLYDCGYRHRHGKGWHG